MNPSDGRVMPRLLVAYLFSVSLAVFLWREPLAIVAIFVVHLLMAPWVGVPMRRLVRLAWNLRFFFAFLVILQAVLPPKGHFLVEWAVVTFDLDFGGSHRPHWTLGAATGMFQCMQIYTMVLVAAIVRSVRDGRIFRAGLRGWFIPESVTDVVDSCIGQLEERRRSSRRRMKGAGESETGHPTSPVRSLLRGDVGWIIDRLEGVIGQESADESDSTGDHDAGLIRRITMVMLSLRLLKVTPGTGLTPGFQNVIVVPLLCLAADRTRGRWGAATVGTSAGLLAVMLGLGRNGVFILPAHILPGVVVDLGWSFVRHRPLRRTTCMVIGTLAGLARFSGMFFVLFLLDNTELLAAVPFFGAGHLFFGALSGAVTFALVRESRSRDTRPGRQGS
jgi:hypothetical protein